MSEEQDQPLQEKSDSEPSGPLGGERLAEARREQQVSVLEVAKELHLDEPKVRALERNDFDVLGAPVFAKGHLRKYAQLVGVSEDDVIADYYRMTRSVGVPPVVAATKTSIRQELSPGPWIAVIIVIVVAAISYWWFAIQSRPDATEAPVPEELAPPEESAPQDAAVQSPPASDESVVPAAALPDEEPVAAQPSPEPVTQTLAEGEMSLLMNFSGDCWAEISDATGRRLFFAMGRAGQSVDLTGTSPLAALFGNAENVSLRVNGNDYPISPSSLEGRTARLTILNP